jgi:ligand-binding sensor domain-containing protein
MAGALLLCVLTRGALALDPQKSLTQYSRTVWSQEHGLPQDTIRAIAQTTDGYLWLGTDEGLARFDGYEFVVFNKDNGDLPGNSITALAAARDGSLWIGTSNGLTCYRDKRFRTYTTKQGLPDNAITALVADHAGTLWIVAGVYLSRYQRRQVHQSGAGAGPAGDRRARHPRRLAWRFVGRGFRRRGQAGGREIPAGGGAADLGGNIVTSMLVDRHDNLWLGGSLGLIERSPAGKIRRYTERDGLPNVRSGAVGRSRRQHLGGHQCRAGAAGGGRLVTSSGEGGFPREMVRCVFEDREGDLWVGSNSGLNRLRDDVFTVYGKSEGLPSDEPNTEPLLVSAVVTLCEGRDGALWAGTYGKGLWRIQGEDARLFTVADGLSSDQIRSLYQDPRARSGSALSAGG